MSNESRHPGEGAAAGNVVLGNDDTSQDCNKSQAIDSFGNIPDEMKSYSSGVCWRIEHDANSVAKKIPFDASTGRKASHSDPSTWCTFDQTVSAFRDGNYDGIGFVFSNADPYAGIDLDDTNGDAWLWEKHQGIFDAFDSYAELSPSGNGLHIIVKGAVPAGRRRHKAEVYSSQRFFTMTGNVYRAAPIAERNDLLNQLWVDIRPVADVRADAGFDKPQVEIDNVVCGRMFTASNGGKARDLYEGRWQGHYASQSEADFALIDIIAFYTNNREQCARIFNASALGARNKQTTIGGVPYVAHMVSKTFAEKLPAHDFTHFFRENAADEDADELPWVDADELDGKPVPPPEWLVPGWIPHANVTLKFSDGGGGKSTLAAQLCASAVLGRDWIGLSVVRQGSALHFAAEDDAGDDHRRRAAIAAAFGVRLADLKGFVTMPLAGHDARLAVSAGRGDTLALTPLFHRVEAKIAALRPVVVVFDNLADIFDGNEISRNQARWFINQLRRVAIGYDCTIIVTAHPSRDGINSKRGDSGSTAWNNSVRSRLYLQDVEGEPDCRTLEVKKVNAGRKGEQVSLRWAFGTFHAVAHAADKTAHRLAADKATDELFLEILADFTTKGTPLSASHNSGTRYAPRLMAQHLKANGTKEVGFKFAMLRLIAEGRVQERVEKINRRDTTVICAVLP